MLMILVVGILALALVPGCHPFVHPHYNGKLQKNGGRRLDVSTRWGTKTGEIEKLDDDSSLEVVLFGIGDLRADDHEGLRKSLERASKLETSSVLPLIVLDNESIMNLPGAVAHTEDTACMIGEAIQDLKGTLQKMNLNLHVHIGGDSLVEGLSKVLYPYLGTTPTDVRVHVCDHGLVDNNMNYAPFANLHKDYMPPGCTIVPWSCALRNAPWENIESVPETYDEYTKKFNFEPIEPVSTAARSLTSTVNTRVEEFSECPSAQEISDQIQKALALDPKKCIQEKNTGIYSTHWGGLSASTVGESKVLEMLRFFVDECGEDDEVFAKRSPLDCTRNKKSLEHATMVWSLRGDGSKGTPETKNIIAGELLSRYLLAPLMLGTLSPRRLWYSVKKAPSPLFVSPLRTLVETREWHKLFASKCMLASKATRNDGLTYKYWRWHGFLCRYGEQTVKSSTSSSSEKEGILLIHGFGASANQWQKNVDALATKCGSDPMEDDSAIECLVPDLIGFGQSEKPPITYSGFTWESYTSDFVKEIACNKNNWRSFVIGGNSIGGFVSMCAAANDATTDPDAISGCGAPGTGRCAGAILMNPAGVIRTKEDVEAIESSVLDKLQLQSVAQIIAKDGLPPCKPLPRPVARAVGNGLLSYLRPRIQSICVNLYPTNPDAVDDKLCQNILRDSLDPGAINVMISGSKLPLPRTYNEVVAADFGQCSSSVPESQFTGPILLAQGILDPLNDAKGRARQLKTLRDGIQVAELQGGHCPHDEIPEEVASAVMNWMKETRSERMAMTQRSLQIQQ